MIHKLIAPCKDYLWGGTRLKTEYGKQTDADIAAESWELSCHKDGPCTLADCGMTLPDYLKLHPERAGTACAQFPEFPMLIKLIDADRDLSVQVHPDDAYAREHENQLGKTEMWYVVDARPGAYLYCGFARDMTKEELRRAIGDNTLCEQLNRVEVKPGDVFFIEAGTIHAIGAGCLIAEVQQSSNVTYRVYDYGRKGADGKPRALHVEQALDVTKLTRAAAPRDFAPHLGKCRYFTADLLEVDGETSVDVDASSFRHLLVLSGSVHIACAEGALDAAKGCGVFADAGTGRVTLTGTAKVLVSYVEPQAYRVGVDLGGTNIKAGVVDADNRVVASHSVKTLAQRPWREVAADMAACVRTALEKAGVTLDACESVGIGCPGTVDARTGIVVYSNNFKDWENIPLGPELERLLGRRVRMSNDANCAALGEYVAGSAKGCGSMVMITLGTGVGGGVVFDGRVFEGGGPGGAELGHTLAVENGELCTCGRRGCLEAYCSATALIRDAKRAAAAHPESALNTLCGGNPDKMNGIIPFQAARAGDAAAKHVVDEYIRRLGEGIVNFVNIFRPEMVLISGGICGEKEYLTDPLNAFVRANAFAGERVPIPPVRTASLGNTAGIVGAANL